MTVTGYKAAKATTHVLTHRLGCFLYGKVCKFIVLDGLLVAEVAAVDRRLWAANVREPLLHSLQSVRTTLYDSLDGSPAGVANPSAHSQFVSFSLGVFAEENTLDCAGDFELCTM